MNSLNSSETIDCDVIGDKTFINQLLGEMKSQFNRSEKKSPNGDDDDTDDLKNDLIKTETESSMSITNENDTTKSSQVIEADNKCDDNNVSTTTDSNEVKEEKSDENNLDDEKPRIVLLFKKPNNNDIKDTSPNRRASLRNKSTNDEKVDENVVKRSSRRRSKDCNESVLQSAIARKEKSYNESNKPQRLSRPLKPTKKILENLALAKQEHKTKSERTKSPTKQQNSDNNIDGLTDDETSPSKRKHKHQHNHKGSKRHSKRIRSVESDKEQSDSDVSAILEESNGAELIKCTRRSQRISSSRLKEESSMDGDDASIDLMQSMQEQSNYPSEDPECSIAGAELIASRLCLCTKNTLLCAAIEENEVTYCTAVDNVGEKIVGCSRKCENLTLLRPSRRVPYVLLCELHRNRLLRHNCCPTCGIFCTQGKFVECSKKHQYHRECQISVGNMECCPHCGLSTAPIDVQITMHSAKKAVILPFQKSHYPTAKITFQTNNTKLNGDDDGCPSPPLIDHDLLPSLDNVNMDVDEEFSENDLLEAIKTGDLERLAVILGTRSVDLNFKIADFNDGTILHYAAQSGLLAIVHMLVVAGMEVDVFDKEQNTPLMLAICSNKNETVQYLIKVGANFTLKGTDGMTALHLASKCGNSRGCQMLVKAGHELHSNFVNSQDDGGWTPLVWACEHGYVDVVNYLILNGADASLRDVEHNVALHWAAFSGSSKIIELLLNIKGCDVNAVNAHGDTPLHIGSREDRYNCIVILLARGADVTLVNKNSETPLDCVPDGGESCKIIALNVYLQGITCSEYGKRRNILTNDISKGKESNPVQCINMVDDEDLPTNYTYITKNCVTTENVCIDTKISSMNSCSCEERCTMELCSCTKMSLKCWYDEEGKLSSDFNYSDSPLIFECNEGCACNAITCNNRVVQKGITQRFQLFKTLAKGWSVNTLRFIPKGGYVCEYVGEILTDVEADQREDDSYLFDLDNRDGESFCIDAKYYGSLARFINHSCKPNLHPVKVFVEHHDLRFPRIALFANRDILADEELSFDYGDKFWLVKCKSFTCQCESSECRYSVETIQETINNYNKKTIHIANNMD